MKLFTDGFLLKTRKSRTMINNIYPLVTIAIPTYNRANSYLGQTLQSALSQTYQNIEIIVSDNCSSDNTEMVVKSFSDPRIRYFKQAKNIGPNNNFNFCLEQAKGDYFLLLQDDDLIDSDFVEVCMRAANYNTDIGIIRTGTRVIDSNGTVLYESPNMVGGLAIEDFFRGWFAGKTSWYLCSTLFNTKRLREIGGFQSKHQLVQDGMAIVQLAAKFGRVDVREVKASFRKHPSEMTFATKVSHWCEDYLILLNLMCSLVSRDKELVRNEGMRFFCTLNYNRARAIKSSVKRFSTYLMVYRKFGYKHSPLRYLVLPRVLRIIKQVLKPIRQRSQ